MYTCIGVGGPWGVRIAIDTSQREWAHVRQHLPDYPHTDTFSPTPMRTQRNSPVVRTQGSNLK